MKAGEAGLNSFVIFSIRMLLYNKMLGIHGARCTILCYQI